jgi:hypothetical protein
MNIISEKKNIKALIATDSIRDALVASMDFASNYGVDDDVNAIVMASRSYTKFRRDEINNVLTSAEARKECNTIVISILRLIDDVETNFSMRQRMQN